VADLNMGRLVRGDPSEGFVPAEAMAVMEVLESHGEFHPQPPVDINRNSNILYNYIQII
jgi:5,10-methylene-tetrahydrofolate dehydrogenase/methenyl tetrahydrofolate cyclohydrolase